MEVASKTVLDFTKSDEFWSMLYHAKLHFTPGCYLKFVEAPSTENFNILSWMSGDELGYDYDSISDHFFDYWMSQDIPRELAAGVQELIFKAQNFVESAPHHSKIQKEEMEVEFLCELERILSFYLHEYYGAPQGVYYCDNYPNLKEILQTAKDLWKWAQEELVQIFSGIVTTEEFDAECAHYFVRDNYFEVKNWDEEDERIFLKDEKLRRDFGYKADTGKYKRVREMGLILPPREFLKVLHQAGMVSGYQFRMLMQA